MSNSTEEIHPTLLDLFDELSLRETFERVLYGLRQPRTTGEYKWARFRLKRLLSPVCAVVVPIIILFVIVLLGGTPPRVEDGFITTIVPRPVEPPPLDDVPDFSEPIVTQSDIAFSDPPASDVSFEPIAALRPPLEGMPKQGLIPVAGVMQARAPIQFSGVYSKRAAAASGNVSGAGATSATEAAVLRALRWLQSVQETDGSWTLASGGEQGAKAGAAPAMTGLALLTYLAHGETPASEEFGYTVEAALRWLLNAQEADGRFKGRDSHDYSHPIATFALCEAYGMAPNPMLETAAKRALRVVIDGQNRHGGWTYNCKPDARNDLSYTGWCVQAIKAAKLARIYCVGLDEALASSVGGLCHNASPAGEFGYTGPTKSNLTGVGVLGLQLLGGKSPQYITRGLSALKNVTCDWDNPLGRNPIYYWYYITQVKFLEGRSAWEDWEAQLSSELVQHQTRIQGSGVDGKDLGFWEPASQAEHCKSRIYNTTLCTLSLEVYYKIGGIATPIVDKANHEIENEDDVPVWFIDV
jgi:hypothetical protein